MTKYNSQLFRLEFWLFCSILVVSFIISCTQEKVKIAPINWVKIDTLSTDSISVRAITVMGSNVGFAGNRGQYGLYDSQKKKLKINSIEQDTIVPNFRAVASTTNNFFMLSIQNPALLYKTGDFGEMELVYKEENEKVFYDALTFWNDLEGIAIGDPTEDCLSIILTRNGGKSWIKMACDKLPKVAAGEAAFAASDTNIAVQGNHTWIVTGGVKSRVFYSANKGETWDVFDTPLVQGKETTGGYSIDFYDKKIGFIIGGDYTRVDDNSQNKAITADGGKTWKLVSENSGPGYQSCVQFVPGGNGQQIVSVGKTGIWATNNAGKDWSQLSKTGFYTFRFVNDTIAYAGGNNIIAKLHFK